MSIREDRILFIGTADGLYRATPKGDGYDVEVAGLRGTGFIRFPVAVDQEDPKRMYVGATRGGVYRSIDGGDSWEPANDGVLHRDIWCVIQHPATGMLYAGASPASIYASSDRGDTWHELETLGSLRSTKQWTGPVPPHVSRMKCLDVTPADPSVIYGAIEEGWAVCSRDSGKTWEQIEGIDHDGHMIAVMADDPSIVVSTTGKGIFRSTDAGRSWTPVSDGLEGFIYTPAHLVRDGKDPGFLMTVVTRTGPGGFMKPEGPGAMFARSTDQGAHWQLSEKAVPDGFTGTPRALGADAESQGTYFAGMIDGSVWVSEDRGDSFRPVFHGLPQVTSVAVTYR
jgi:photosystem II stability/assembly factor-like uncharacterized protein